jgi:hypothetical protein
MNFLLEFFNNHRLSITVIIFLMIYSCIYASIIGVNLQDYIDTNWYHLKNRPLLIPFAGFFGKGKGTNIFSKTIYNLYSFFDSIFKKFIGLFIKPFVYFIKLVNKTILSIKNTLQKFRAMAQVTRNLFNATVKKTAKVISNSYSAIVYFQEKLKLIIKKQSALFALFSQFSTSMNFLLYSFIKGPIPRFVVWMPMYAVLCMVFLAICLLCLAGGPFVKMIACPICAICFDSNTLINMNNNSTKKIKDLILGDIIKEGGTINGILIIKANQTPMYSYNDVLVSGSHLVYENYLWKRIENSNLATQIEYDPEKYLYCFITQNNKIYSNNTLFADYTETNDNKVNFNISETVIKHLNKGINLKQKDDINHLYYWGFSKNTIINTKFGDKYINQIKIGDFIGKSKVLGLIELNTKNKKLYNYKDVIASGSQAVCEEGIWLRVHQSIYSTEVEYNEPKIYQVITDDNIVTINDIVFCDFCETHDEEINDKIDKMVELTKNVYKKNLDSIANPITI